jgi:hypothetical protein
VALQVARKSDWQASQIKAQKSFAALRAHAAVAGNALGGGGGAAAAAAARWSWSKPAVTLPTSAGLETGPGLTTVQASEGPGAADQCIEGLDDFDDGLFDAESPSSLGDMGLKG